MWKIYSGLFAFLFFVILLGGVVELFEFALIVTILSTIIAIPILSYQFEKERKRLRLEKKLEKAEYIKDSYLYMLKHKYEEIPNLHKLSETDLVMVERQASESLENEIREENIPEEYARKRRYLLQRRIAKSRALVNEANQRIEDGPVS